MSCTALRMPSGGNEDAANEPKPPALDTATAMSTVPAPSMGPWMMGTVRPRPWVNWVLGRGMEKLTN